MMASEVCLVGEGVRVSTHVGRQAANRMVLTKYVLAASVCAPPLTPWVGGRP